MPNVAVRNARLKEMLIERRREMQDEVQSRIREGRAPRAKEVRDDLEVSDSEIQGDIEVAVLQMTAETLRRIEEALARLDTGQYGSCAECEIEIPERRLRALPFAVRCQACEGKREQQQHSRQRSDRFSATIDP